MQNIPQGTLSDAQIKEFKLNEYIDPVINISQVSPSSIDLPMQPEIYRISRMTLPSKHETIRDAMNKMDATRVQEGAILEVGSKYLIYLGKIEKPLPNGINCHASPKSSTGRIDLHVKLLADHTIMYDTINADFTGELWMLLIPQSFPIQFYAHEALIQIRFFNTCEKLTLQEVEELIEGGLMLDKSGNKIPREELMVDTQGKLMMTLDLDVENPGYVCRGVSHILDIRKRQEYDSSIFFEKVQLKNGGLFLEPDAFYILSTKEVLHIPDGYAGEMAVSQYKFGEFRAHYAGFFDPGWKGFGTLEVRSSEELFVYDGYPITEMIFEKVSGPVEVSYGAKPIVNYFNQVGPTLSKYFKKL
ncbi:MAG: 2'-deoxycytidine 5'-triphosphate deaminase [Patescibacteria group bacterium]